MLISSETFGLQVFWYQAFVVLTSLWVQVSFSYKTTQIQSAHVGQLKYLLFKNYFGSSSYFTGEFKKDFRSQACKHLVSNLFLGAIEQNETQQEFGFVTSRRLAAMSC